LNLIQARQGTYLYRRAKKIQVKTQIVQLELHDDYISVRDRMGWGQTTRILLVWPHRGAILRRRLDLTLVKRHSAALGSQLALVTRDREIRYQADLLNIPVYKSVREAEQSLWRHPRKRKKSAGLKRIPSREDRKTHTKPDLTSMRDQAHPNPPAWLMHPAVRILIFTLGVLSMFVVAAVFIPSAEIFVIPATKTETIIIDVVANPDQKTVDLSGAVPAHIKSVEVAGSGNTPATGETKIPRQTAKGNVSFVNLTEDEITIPTGTVVSTEGEHPIRFSTTRSVVVPVGATGKTAPIEAILPGADGNISAENIVAIEGTLGLNLSVINQRRTSGGSNFPAVTPSEDDYQLLYNQLLDSLQDDALVEFQNLASPNHILLSSIPVEQRIIEESFFPEPGKPADFLELEVRAEYKFHYASEDDLFHLGRIVLDRHATGDYTPRPETLQVKQLTEPILQPNGSATWRMQASWQLGANLDETKAVANILGLEPEQALRKLNENTSIEEGTIIKITPEWWPRLPMVPFRINLINKLDTTPENNLRIGEQEFGFLIR
jgi:hypothetical protein